MDLNVNNYDAKELLVILDSNHENSDDDEIISFEKLQNILFKKINEITSSKQELPNPKDDIIAFYNKCFTRLVNEYQLYKEINNENNLSNDNFISVKEKLLPELTNTHVVQENESMVAKHTNHVPLPTWNSHLKLSLIHI